MLGDCTRGKQLLNPVPGPARCSPRQNRTFCFTTPYRVASPSPVPLPFSRDVKGLENMGRMVGGNALSGISDCERDTGAGWDYGMTLSQSLIDAHIGVSMVSLSPPAQRRAHSRSIHDDLLDLHEARFYPAQILIGNEQKLDIFTHQAQWHPGNFADGPYSGRGLRRLHRRSIAAKHGFRKEKVTKVPIQERRFLIEARLAGWVRLARTHDW
jgi:hypothetical protein